MIEMLLTKQNVADVLYELQPIRLQDIASSLTTIASVVSLVLQAIAVGLRSLALSVVSLSLQTITVLVLWLCGVYVSYVLLDVLSLYVIATLFALLFLNLGERREGELSAYSVFNDGFQELLGTLNAEQFDNEIRHREMRPARESESDEEEELDYFIPSTDDEEDSQRDRESDQETEKETKEATTTVAIDDDESDVETEKERNNSQKSRKKCRKNRKTSSSRKEPSVSIISSNVLDDDDDEEFTAMLRRREIAWKVRAFNRQQRLDSLIAISDERTTG